ncbi:MAG TPA: uracil-DNA glycosylase family protein [Burkholderiaceae bacterium]|nr:uracil-DNA glycosylase family protein [Burkholderiaceae bacterium]
MQTKKANDMSDPASHSQNDSFDALVRAIRACRVCRDEPRYGARLDHEPRPIIQVSRTARICIASQAPGIRVHESGRPFDDRSGIRLRQWMAIDESVFYDESRIAILPMGFCFPGNDANGGDLPPRRECAEIWRSKLFAHLPDLKLVLVIGGYAQRWHLGAACARQGVTQTVQAWRELYRANPAPHVFPLPHPSWHNHNWLKRNPWFETDMLPVLREDIRAALA